MFIVPPQDAFILAVVVGRNRKRSGQLNGTESPGKSGNGVSVFITSSNEQAMELSPIDWLLDEEEIEKQRYAKGREYDCETCQKV